MKGATFKLTGLAEAGCNRRGKCVATCRNIFGNAGTGTVKVTCQLNGQGWKLNGKRCNLD